VNEAARQGFRMLLVVAAGLVLHRLLALLTPDASVEAHVVPLVLSVVIAFLLLRGYGWARSYIAVSLGLASLFTLVAGGALAMRHWWGVPFVLFAPLYAWGAWAVWSSPKVQAYIAHRERQRNPDLSLTDA